MAPGVGAGRRRSRCHRSGHVPRSRVERRRDALLASAALMVMPSVREGWCLAVVEAAAQATPSVAYSGAGGVNESIVDGVTGLLADDYDDLVVATVSRLLHDPRRLEAMGNAARERATTFSWQSTADVFEAQFSRRSEAHPRPRGSRRPSGVHDQATEAVDSHRGDTGTSRDVLTGLRVQHHRAAALDEAVDPVPLHRCHVDAVPLGRGQLPTRPCPLRRRSRGHVCRAGCTPPWAPGPDDNSSRDQWKSGAVCPPGAPSWWRC